MTRPLAARVTRPPARALRPAILAALTLAAMLLCLLAVHSAGGVHGLGHGLEHGMSAAASSAAHSVDTRNVDTHDTVVRSAVDSVATTGGMNGHSTLAMTCSILLALGAVVALARHPSLVQRLLEGAGFVVDSFRAIPLHLHRPSLTLLSISRV